MNQFNSKGGDQNIAQGDHSIGQQNNYYNSLPPAPPPIPHFPPSLDTCFLGRDRECDWLLDKLYPGKVVAVCGPGGMGKSALAAQAVSRLESARFPDGIILHRFYEHPRIEQALQRIAKAFGIEAKPSLEIAVEDALAGRKALLELSSLYRTHQLP
ncbi:hypothetical protein [Candidatus Electronema sp. PJ]|uniref:hypothetical protein n=1 Tax=Candidatus Electronema sp. PJ TaxID=3401572 RepID=UPI003AA8D9C5